MKKLIVLLLSAILCLQLSACDILTGSEEQMQNAPPKVAHLFSVADTATLEIALTQGQTNSFSSAEGTWSRRLDLSDQTVYGNALSKLQTAELISENGKLNPAGWLKPAMIFTGYRPNDSDKDSITNSFEAAFNTVANATGTYVDGAYRVNDSYGVRAVGISDEKGFTVCACIVDLTFRSAEGGVLSFCTGENGSTLENIIHSASETTKTNGSSSSSSTSIGSSFAGSITISSVSSLRLVFFDTETYDILGSAKVKSDVSGVVIGSSSAAGENNSNAVTFVALDQDGNEIEGNLNLGELLPGEARRVSVLLFNESNGNPVVGDKNDKEKDKKHEYDDKSEYEDGSSDDTREPDTDTDMNYAADGYTDKYQYEVVTGMANWEIETGLTLHYITALQFDISFNLVFTDK